MAAVLGLAFCYSFVSVVGKDELCFAVARKGPIGIANELYFTWSGRWLGMALLGVAAKSVSLLDWHYGLLVALSFPIWLGAFYAIAASALNKHRLPAALLMLAVFWSAAPFPGEVFYWLAGIVIYAVAFLFGAVAVLLIVRRSYWAVIPAIAATLVNELAGIALIAGLLPFYRRRSVQIALAGTAVAVSVVVFSPGNALRQQTLEYVSPARLIWYVVRPYDSPWTLLADARLLAMAAFIAAIPKPERKLPVRTLVAVLFSILVSTIAVTFGGHMTPQGRVLDFLFAGMICAGFVGALSLRWAAPLPVVASVLALALVTGPSVRMVFHDPLPTVSTVPCRYSINSPPAAKYVRVMHR